MLQVKLFQHPDIRVLESSVNDWLREKTLYSAGGIRAVEYSSNSNENGQHYTVMVLHECGTGRVPEEARVPPAK